MKKAKINFIDDNNLSINDDYYTSAIVKMKHIKKKEQVEIKASEPIDRKSTRLNSSHVSESRMPSSA